MLAYFDEDLKANFMSHVRRLCLNAPAIHDEGYFEWQSDKKATFNTHAFRFFLWLQLPCSFATHAQYIKLMFYTQWHVRPHGFINSFHWIAIMGSLRIIIMSVEALISKDVNKERPRS